MEQARNSALSNETLQGIQSRCIQNPPPRPQTLRGSLRNGTGPHRQERLEGRGWRPCSRTQDPPQNAGSTKEPRICTGEKERVNDLNELLKLLSGQEG